MLAFKNRLLSPTIAIEFFEIGKRGYAIGLRLYADKAGFARLHDNQLISKALISYNLVSVTQD